jgi:phage terminase small subunit
MKKPSARGSKPTPPARATRRAVPICRENRGQCSIHTEPSPVETRFSPPKHLRPDTAEWWRSVAKDYALEPHHLRLLTLAAESWDRGVEAREAIAKHGAVYVDRFEQPRARPEVAIERDSRISFARLVRELALDLDPPDEAGRPPRLGSVTEKRAGPVVDWDAEDRRTLGLD